MRTSTSRGHRRICQATIQLAETGLFRQFQYLTVPLHVSDDFMNTALRKALAPAFENPARNRKEQ
jgi:hypothetical protein